MTCEVKKRIMNVERRDDVLAKVLDKPPVTGHMQGLRKFITALIYVFGYYESQ